MSNTSFLPEDYLDQKAERRTNIISLTLFGIVMIAVFAAFLVTNREWSNVKDDQQRINVKYQEAAVQIERLNELERQKDQVLNKAELAAALVERVPRSILLAELISRMPPGLGLLELKLKSDEIKAAREPVVRNAVGRLKGPERAKTREEAAKEPKKIEAPRFRIALTLVGVAPTDLEVSRYMAQLNAHPLLHDVRLEYSEERDFEGSKMRKFEIKMTLDPDADVREMAPLIKRDLKDPMSDDVALNAGGGYTASARPGGKEGG
ncbi:MAG: PilN domain-containing protein [Planctomycetota bacterium]|jgi:Tfp pilus assembly protein PilN